MGVARASLSVLGPSVFVRVSPVERVRSLLEDNVISRTGSFPIFKSDPVLCLHDALLRRVARCLLYAYSIISDKVLFRL